MDGDLFCNYASTIYLRIADVYYQRIVSVNKGGWRTITEVDLPADIIWNQLQPVQMLAYRPALVDAKLLAQ